MAIIKQIATDGLELEEFTACPTNPMDIGIGFLHDGVKDLPAWPNATNWVFHYAYGLDMGSSISIAKLIVYDNRLTDGWFATRNSLEVWASLTNSGYSFIKAWTAPTRTQGVWELLFDQPVKYRYFKVFCSEIADGLWVDVGNWCQIVELEAWGEEFFPKLSGTVKQKGIPVQRTVKSFIRSTAELYDSVLSEADGTFELDAPDESTEMFVIAFDDDLGDQYNALIYDRVKGLL